MSTTAERRPTPPEWRVPLRELVALHAEIRRADARYKVPPCLECGAATAEEAETKCHCSGDKDDCHGCHLWEAA